MSLPEEWNGLGISEQRVPALKMLPRKVLSLLAVEWAKQLLPKRGDWNASAQATRAMERWLTDPTESNFEKIMIPMEQLAGEVAPGIASEADENLFEFYNSVLETADPAPRDFHTYATLVAEDLAYSKKKDWYWIYKSYLDALGPDLTFKPEWKIDTAVNIAKNIFKKRNLKVMPILADALQDAGCDHEEIIAHLQRDKCLLSDWTLSNLLDLK